MHRTAAACALSMITLLTTAQLWGCHGTCEANVPRGFVGAGLLLHEDDHDVAAEPNLIASAEYQPTTHELVIDAEPEFAGAIGRKVRLHMVFPKFENAKAFKGDVTGFADVARAKGAVQRLSLRFKIELQGSGSACSEAPCTPDGKGTFTLETTSPGTLTLKGTAPIELRAVRERKPCE